MVHFSPILGRAGYKMNLQLYPNGDRQARNTHMSIFLVIWKGDYDPILPWPFRLRVTLMLLDHKGKNHISTPFTPQRDMAAFARPQQEKNKGSGLPHFCELSKLQQKQPSEYVKDDTVYIKVIVHNND